MRSHAATMFDLFLVSAQLQFRQDLGTSHHLRFLKCRFLVQKLMVLIPHTGEGN